MQYLVKVNFTGRISAIEGSVIELEDKEVIADLLQAGYIEPMGAPEPVKKASKKTVKKG